MTEVAVVTRDLLIHWAGRATRGTAEQKSRAESTRVLDTLEKLLGEIIPDRCRSREHAERR
jgi:hypothetical protein